MCHKIEIKSDKKKLQNLFSTLIHFGKKNKIPVRNKLQTKSSDCYLNSI